MNELTAAILLAKFLDVLIAYGNGELTLEECRTLLETIYGI